MAANPNREEENKYEALLKRGLPFSELKEFILDHMGSVPHFSVNPEEPLMIMQKGKQEENAKRGNSPLYKKFLAMQDEFYYNFWMTEIMPKISQAELLTFLEHSEVDLGKTFYPSLAKHTEKFIGKFDSEEEQT
ncbi:MAG: hypothetical protein ACMG6E_04520 [Candidatus Roizmanbacteria bacterium]